MRRPAGSAAAASALLPLLLAATAATGVRTPPRAAALFQARQREAAAAAPDATTLRLLTYNLDCSVCDLKVKDPWRERLAYFADILGAYQPDIACLQELITKKEAVEELGGMAPLANHTRIFYEGSLLADPDATLYVDEAKFRVEDSGVFWLSPEPDRPFSTGFAHHGAQEPRVFVWATLREAASGAPLIAGCTHFDNNSPSQEKSADLVIERLEALQVGDYASAPVLAMGDWNSQNVSEPSFGSSAHYNNSEAWKRLTGTGDAAGRHGLALVDVADLAPPGARRIDNRTSSGAKTSKPAARTDAIDEPLWPAADEPQGGERIDHILVHPAADWAVTEYVVDDTVYGPNGRTPSDHRPVVAVAQLRWQ